MLLRAVQEGFQQRAHGLEGIGIAQRPPALPHQALAAQCGPYGSQEGTATLVGLVHEKRSHPHRGTPHGKMLRAMPGGMLKVVAVRFQGLARRICTLPPRPSTAHALINVTLSHAQVRHPPAVLDLVLAHCPRVDAMHPHVRSRCLAGHVVDEAQPMHDTRGAVMPLVRGHAPSVFGRLHLCAELGMIAVCDPEDILQPMIVQGLNGGALARRLSAVMLHLRWGGSWRTLAMQRFAAWRSPALLAVPSCVLSGSGLSGRPACTSGWRSAAPNIW